MKIVADRNLCIGAGQCVMVAAELFTQSEEDGLVIVKIAKPSPEAAKDAEYAVLSCPTRALTLETE